MSEQWYYGKGGKRAGPISFAELKQLSSSGQLSPTDLVWTDGMPNWVAAQEIKGLFANRAIRAIRILSRFSGKTKKRFSFSLPESLAWVKPVFLTLAVCLPVAYGVIMLSGYDPLNVRNWPHVVRDSFRGNAKSQGLTQEAGVAGGSKGPSEAPPLTAPKICRDFADNESAAIKKYKDKTLTVTGTITFLEINRGSSLSGVDLEGGQESHVRCFFKENQQRALSKVSNGQRITVRGRCGTTEDRAKPLYPGGPEPLGIVMWNCDLVEAGPKPMASVDATDLESTGRRADELIQEVCDAIAQAEAQNRGNQLALSEARAKAFARGTEKINGEFRKLRGQTVQWLFTVKGVESTGSVEKLVRLKPVGTSLSLGFEQRRRGGPYDTTLQVGHHLTETAAKKLRPGDRILITGSVHSITVPNELDRLEFSSYRQISIQLYQVNVDRGEVASPNPPKLPAEASWEQVAAVWESAGAVRGRMGVNRFCYLQFKEKGWELEEKEPSLPALWIPRWREGMMVNLPAPGLAFGLDLGESGITDAGLKELAALEQLTALNLAGTKVTDAGLKELAALQQISSISLQDTKVTGPGLKEFARLKQLTLLDLTHTPAVGPFDFDLGRRNEGVNELRKALPKCRIIPTSDIEPYKNSSGGANTEKITPRGSQPLVISASDLLDEYWTDQSAAEKKYNGKTLEVTGTVLTIWIDENSRRYAGGPSLQLGVTNGNVSRGGIHCYFDDKFTSEVAKLSTGQSIRVRGRCDPYKHPIRKDRIDSRKVLIENCELQLAPAEAETKKTLKDADADRKKTEAEKKGADNLPAGAPGGSSGKSSSKAPSSESTSKKTRHKAPDLSEPDTVVRSFLEALVNQDPESLKAVISSKAVGQVASLRNAAADSEELSKATTQYRALSVGKVITANRVNERFVIVEERIRSIDKKNSPRSKQVKVSKEPDGWRIIELL